MVSKIEADGFEKKPPVVYTFQVEGLPTIGTLADYAKAWEQWYHGSVHLSPTVLDWKGTHHVVKTVERVRGEDDNYYLKLSANGETASVTIDGRA